MNPAARHELQTLRDLIRYGVSRLNAAQVALGHGSDNAWDEAVYLTPHALHFAAGHAGSLPGRPRAGRGTRALDLIDRRVTERVPAAYLTNEAWLRGHCLCGRARHRAALAHRRTAGPGPDALGDPYAVEHVLDMCTGSGCLAILGALAFPHAQVDAVDVSPDALDVARRNVDDYGWPSGWNCTRATCSTRCPRAATT